MSRGLGKIQQQCLSVLTEQDKLLDSIAVAAIAVGRNEITDVEHVSFRRALRRLKAMGKVVDMKRRYRNGRRCWATPAVAKRYFDRVENSMGRYIANNMRRESRFTPEYYPEIFGNSA